MLNKQAAARGASGVNVTCPSDLNAKIGASEVCPARDSQGANYRITATVTSVSGSHYELAFKVTVTIGASEVASKAKTSLNQQAAARGASIVNVTCPSDLDYKVGASEVCPASDSRGAKYQITTTVTSVSGSHYGLAFKVAAVP